MLKEDEKLFDVEKLKVKISETQHYHSLITLNEFNC